MVSSEERKLVTVLFADLAGSTDLAVRHDPEELRALLSAFFDEMAQQIRSFGGTVEKYAGDAVMAVFGVPHVHEDDTERAVRAALAMQQSLADLNPSLEEEFGTRLELRVGIATGQAVATTSADREFLVTGQVANLAARLQAAGSGIVISAETHERLDPMVEGERLGPLELKGFPEPVLAYSVRGLDSSAGRPRRTPGVPTSFVGRDAELDELRGCLDGLRRGLGQIVFVTGEVGIGKSRLLAELREELPEEVRWIEARCEAHAHETAYAPFVQILRSLIQLRGGESPTVARTRLRAALQPLTKERYAELQPFIAQLLGVEGGGAIDPQALQPHLLLTVRALLEAVAARAPIALVFEDIHWADDASLELLDALLGLTDFAPVMMLITSRPDQEGASWDLRFRAQRTYPHRLTELPLQSLAEDCAQRLAEDLLPGAQLPERLRRRIREHAEGNPLFMEQVVSSLVEQGVVRRDGERWVAGDDPHGLPVPKSLQGVIAARIDRLPPDVKRVLQHASVLGRVFTRTAVQALGDAAHVDPALASLMRAGLIGERARLPEPEYQFKHTLTRDAAYESILSGERRSLHRSAATFLEQTLADPSGEHAAVLARHWRGAEEPEKALDYALRAGERARQLYAQSDAVAHYWQALDLLEALPPTPERSDAHIDAVLALIAAGGFLDRGRRAAARHMDRAISAAAELGELARLARLEAAMAAATFDFALFEEALGHAKASGDPVAPALVMRRMANAHGMTGEYERALLLVDEAIEALAAAGRRYDYALSRVGEGRCYCARAGRLQEALHHAAVGREIGEELADPLLKAWGAMEAEPYLYLGLWEEAARVGEEGLRFDWEIGEWGVIIWSSAWVAISHLKLGQPERAARVLSRALRELPPSRGTHAAMIYLHSALAQYHLAVDEHERALSSAERALEQARRSPARMDLGAASRTVGQTLAAMEKRDEADEAFRSSLEVLEQIQSRPELGQTLLAYGCFLSEIGDGAGRGHIERAARVFDDIGATGWLGEARGALR